MTAAWHVDLTHVERITAYLREKFPGWEVSHISPADDLRQQFRVRRRARLLLLVVGRAALDDMNVADRVVAFLWQHQIAESMDAGVTGSMTVVPSIRGEDIFRPDAEVIQTTGEKRCRECRSTDVLITGEVAAELITDHPCECGSCGRRFIYRGRREA